MLSVLLNFVIKYSARPYLLAPRSKGDHQALGIPVFNRNKRYHGVTIVPLIRLHSAEINIADHQYLLQKHAVLDRLFG